MITTGIPSAARPISSSTRGTVPPPSSAAWVDRGIVGPSARGSLNGTPTSRKSAPAASTSLSASSEAAGVGCPAVRYGMSAAWRLAPPPLSPPPRPAPARMARQRAAIGCSDKIVADVDAVLHRVGDLDDRAGEVALRIALREVREEPGVVQRALGRRHDAHDGPVHVADVGVGAVDDRDLVGIEDDAGAHG